MDDPTATRFDALDLDPWSTPEEITEALRERAEAADPEERLRLQAAWRELTLHPGPRLDAALLSHPRRRAAAPSPRRRRADLASPLGDDLAAEELVILPPLRLGLAQEAPPLDGLDDDEVLRGG